MSVLFMIGLLVPLAQGKTKLVQSWADPTAANHQFKKVIAMAVIDNAELRRRAEDAMVRNIRKVQAVASYTIVAPGEEKNIEVLKRKLREGGFDSAVVLRLFSVDDKSQVFAATVPNAYTSYYSYRAWAWPNVAPGGVKYERVVELETLFYSLTDDKRLYSAVSKTKNPEDALQLIDEIAKVIGDELRKKGIAK